MKPITEWGENDLTHMIADEAEENINTEFKRAEAVENMNISASAERCKTDIGKDVSSFANSAGGHIIYGMEEDEGQHIRR
jgi:predicted HTH transcriptional regulator